MALLVGTDYLFSSRVRPENLFPGKPRIEYLFSTTTKSKQKEKKGGGVGGGGVLVRGFSRGGQDMAFYVCITFCRLLARNIAYLLECFDIDFSVCNVYFRISKKCV